MSAELPAPLSEAELNELLSGLQGALSDELALRLVMTISEAFRGDRCPCCQHTFKELQARATDYPEVHLDVKVQLGTLRVCTWCYQQLRDAFAAPLRDELDQALKRETTLLDALENLLTLGRTR